MNVIQEERGEVNKMLGGATTSPRRQQQTKETTSTTEKGWRWLRRRTIKSKTNQGKTGYHQRSHY
jgi:hypothetical protein